MPVRRPPELGPIEVTILRKLHQPAPKQHHPVNTIANRHHLRRNGYLRLANSRSPDSCDNGLTRWQIAQSQHVRPLAKKDTKCVVTIAEEQIFAVEWGPSRHPRRGRAAPDAVRRDVLRFG